jgi:dihydrofolate synthase / folylpolyglutamate synthase
MNKSQILYLKLQERYSKKINLNLKRINLALRKLNDIHKTINNPINIIGSDGKFFIVQSLKAFIEKNNQKVSTFTSPHLYDFRHRFWLKDHFISIKELKKNIKIIEKLKIKLTLFELTSLIYYLSAAKLKGISYSLVEAGLMFAGDSTRVWDKPKFQIITNINKQHLEWVNPKTLNEICNQKVGYLSNKTTIYVGRQKRETMKIIKKILSRNKSKKIFYGDDWSIRSLKNKKIYKDNKGTIIFNSPTIKGNAMLDNLGLSIKVARDLNISKNNIVKAIPEISYEGRMQWIKKGKLRKKLYDEESFLIDGCHSESSAKNLATYLKTLNKNIYGIWGMQKNKKPSLFIKQFKGIFKKIIVLKIPDEKNSCSPLELQNAAKKIGTKSEVAHSIEAGIKKISSNKNKVIVTFGSLYLTGKILSLN